MSKEKLVKEIYSQGLSSSQARERLKKFGQNTVQPKAVWPMLAFVKRLSNPLVVLILISALISYYLCETANAVILCVMILVTLLLDFINSYRSEKAIKDLLKHVSLKATVWRDGIKKEIPVKELVPGDVIFLCAGNIVPADGRIIECRDFFVNQASLTGESIPVEKNLPSKKVKIKDIDQVFMGTNVVGGFATIEVLKTGKSTEFGLIAQNIETNLTYTEFDRQIKNFSMMVMRVALIMACIAFAANILMERSWLSSFMFAVAITIGLTPELLPVIVSVCLSRGAILMSRKGVIVRRLSSIQNFGSMDVLCTDKTGTLTEGRIALVRHVDFDGKSSDNVLLYSYLNSFFNTNIANPFDEAVKKFHKINVTKYRKVDEIPFDFERKRQTVIVKNSLKKNILITQGAPENILAICVNYRMGKLAKKLTAKNLIKIKDQFNKLSQEGFRVLAVASGEIKTKKSAYTGRDEKDLCLEGFIAFLDPPKVTAKEAAGDLERMGIEIKILTGDNEVLTEKICREIGFDIKGVCTGRELESLDDREAKELISSTTIFARLMPEQKERIIDNLRQMGKTVGYMGDGINDAPALRAADVGITVNNAVDVAKDTADLVLLRKSLRVLKDGAIEGRKTFSNTMKYIQMNLSSSFGNMFSMMAASAFLPFLPMLPTQVMLNDLLYDFSQLALTSDNVDKEEISKPTKWDLKYIKRYMLVFGGISSLFDFLTFALLMMVYHATEKQFQTGWFIESVATQVLVVFVIRTRKLPFLQSTPSWLLSMSTLAVVAIATYLPHSLVGNYFGFEFLSLNIVFALIGLVIIYLLLIQVVKEWFFTRKIGFEVKNKQ